MKIKYLLIATLSLATFSLSSCTMEEDTSGMSSPDNFFRKFSECQSVVNSCYIPIKNIYTYQYMLATECCTDIAYAPSGTLDARLDISPAVPRHGSTVWTQGYIGVQRCNFAINGIERAFKNEVLTLEQYHQLLCEAKCLRAFFYYTLTSFFGDVPFYFDDVTDNEVLLRIQVLPRMDANETRAKCIEDLQSIASLVPQTRTSDNEGDRMGAACAYMLIAKMALWNAYTDTKAESETYWFDVALEALQHLEDIYGPLSQYSYEENVMFRNKNTPESIFEVQHTYTQGGLVYTSNVACICTPYPRSANSAIYDGVEIPELGDNMTVWSAMRPNVYFCQGLQNRRGADIRRNYNMAWEYNGVEFANVNTRPWCGPKFWCPNMQTSQDGNNYKVFRYADAVLMIAECYCGKGEYETAVRYLDMTRVRAGIGNYTYRTPARLEEEIRNERARELFGEFQRKFDLVRWGIWYEATTANSDYAYLQLNTEQSLIKPCHRYYPIPDTEVAYSRYNLDNKEYAMYGL